MLDDKVYQCDDDDYPIITPEGGVIFLGGFDKAGVGKLNQKHRALQANSFAHQSNLGKALRRFGFELAKEPRLGERFETSDRPAVLRHSDPYSKNYFIGYVPLASCDPYSEQKVVQRLYHSEDIKLTMLGYPNQQVNTPSAALEDIKLTMLGYPNQQVNTPSAALMVRTSQDSTVAQLQTKVHFLESYLRKELPYMQLYKFGGTSLLVAIVSLIAWAITGIGVPFHPVFAAMVVPVAIGVMVMAFFLKREARD